MSLPTSTAKLTPATGLYIEREGLAGAPASFSFPATWPSCVIPHGSGCAVEAIVPLFKPLGCIKELPSPRPPVPREPAHP